MQHTTFYTRVNRLMHRYGLDYSQIAANERQHAHKRGVFYLALIASDPVYFGAQRIADGFSVPLSQVKADITAAQQRTK